MYDEDPNYINKTLFETKKRAPFVIFRQTAEGRKPARQGVSGFRGIFFEKFIFREIPQISSRNSRMSS